MLFLSSSQNKEYIYRGQQFERLSDFQARIQNQYPQAKIMEKLLPPNRYLRIAMILIICLNHCFQCLHWPYLWSGIFISLAEFPQSTWRPKNSICKSIEWRRWWIRGWSGNSKGKTSLFKSLLTTKSTRSKSFFLTSVCLSPRPVSTRAARLRPSGWKGLSWRRLIPCQGYWDGRRRCEWICFMSDCHSWAISLYQLI